MPWHLTRGTKVSTIEIPIWSTKTKTWMSRLWSVAMAKIRFNAMFTKAEHDVVMTLSEHSGASEKNCLQNIAHLPFEANSKGGI